MASLVQHQEANYVSEMSLHAINYDALREAMKSEASTIEQKEAFLLEELPHTWRVHYERMTQRDALLLCVEYNGFAYYYDHYTDREMKGAVEYSVTHEERVIGVIGRSIKTGKGREKASAWLKRLIGGTEARWGDQYDKGHFIAHTMGGGQQLNIFPQRRDLNRGRSPQGKAYVAMERYCMANPGTLCFHRPIYTDESSKPSALDYGYLTQKGELVVERFDNSEILKDGEGFKTKLPSTDPRNWWVDPQYLEGDA